MKILTISETETFFRNGGTVTRTTREMPKSFETPEGIVTRQAVNVLYDRDQLLATGGKYRAVYSWFHQ